MSVSAVIKPPEKPSERERAALISLLTDEDAAVYRVVRDKILSCGPAATEWLKPHTLSSDPVLRRRAQEITQHFAREKADDRFLAFCLSERIVTRFLTYLPARVVVLFHRFLLHALELRRGYPAGA